MNFRKGVGFNSHYRQLLADRGLALVGTVRKNRSRPRADGSYRWRSPSRPPPHWCPTWPGKTGTLSDILDYNRNKGSVDNLERVIGTYSVSPDALGLGAHVPEAPAPDTRASKRKRCQMCPSKKDCKTHTVCGRCNKYISKGCSRPYCSECINWGFVRGGTL
ncbi:hypothetical protein DPEC_G00000320 [Dallia pectoralis]|uniref:Uncharacterized protein n=1 Tax=Dallia pectoralis TaxID=75939 RepID=A0ACC2HJK9_DALPE|nr:hypothetical protein DPEC_G00000320 [Dallia pectoralis]